MLLGSVHVGVGLEDLSQAYAVKSMIAKVDQVIVEWAFPDQDVQRFLFDPVAAFLEDPDLANIPGTSSNLPPQTITRLIKFGIPPKLAKHMSEHHCKIVLAAPYLFPHPSSLDFEILNLAYSNKKLVISLDKRDSPNLKSKSNCSITQWFSKYSDAALREQSEVITSDYFHAGIGNQPSSPDIVARNQLWAAELDHLLSRPSVVVVGKNHLYGDLGLLQLLKDKGFEIVSE